ncbi:hypothetical protein MLD38_039868 [Melastoma candidum]|uniref:Uncharacterized protein n=1 Tax=Melastoma candidum TaxID=119954 RepID=A0ACB9L4C5_9MYRT|nr:hypothetical protein MLD38_039868 [Melastoma candidum]
MPMHVNSSAAPAPQVAASRYPWPPQGSPSNTGSHGDTRGMLQHGRQRHNSDELANALPFGFLATAILVSMFLVMAVFERFLRPSSSETTNDEDRHGDVESQSETDGGKGRCSPRQKVFCFFPEWSDAICCSNLSYIDRHSHQASIYESGISVLMPGDDVPSFIAHPAPISRPLEPPPSPSHHQQTIQCQLPAPNTSQASSAHPGINLMNSCYI